MTITAAHQTGDPLTLLFLARDRFKLINDALGHAIGDDCLRHLAQLVSTVVRANDPVARVISLKPVAGLDAEALMGMTEASYIELVQWTGEQARSGKRGKLKPLTEGLRAAPADICQVANHPKEWLRQVQGTESLYYRAIGSAEALMARAEELGQAWMKGVAW